MVNGIKDSKCPGSCPGSPEPKSLSWVPRTKIAVLVPLSWNTPAPIFFNF